MVLRGGFPALAEKQSPVGMLLHQESSLGLSEAFVMVKKRSSGHGGIVDLEIESSVRHNNFL
jgi:hypothetical protein